MVRISGERIQVETSSVAVYATILSEQIAVTQTENTTTITGAFANPAVGTQVGFTVNDATGLSVSQSITIGGRSTDRLTAYRHGNYIIDSISGNDVTATLQDTINNLAIDLASGTAWPFNDPVPVGSFVTNATMLQSVPTATAKKAGVYISGVANGVVREGISPENLTQGPRLIEGSAILVTSLADILMAQFVAEQAGSFLVVRYTEG